MTDTAKSLPQLCDELTERISNSVICQYHEKEGYPFASIDRHTLRNFLEKEIGDFMRQP